MPISEQIQAFELAYLANHSRLFEKAEATFRRIVLGLGNGSEQRMDIDRLLDYFAELQRYESRGTLARPRGVCSRVAPKQRRTQATGCALFGRFHGARLCDFR
jgi:hypothetical protein